MYIFLFSCMCLNKIEEQHLLGSYLWIQMLVLISNLICNNNVTVTSESSTQLMASLFQIKLPKFYDKHARSSLVINLEVGVFPIISLSEWAFLYTPPSCHRFDKLKIVPRTALSDKKYRGAIQILVDIKLWHCIFFWRC